ncbi:TRAP transporter large permease [Devosia alba]|uniref:TRAP transporter large permease n=1 Tax=Devosia alba TaxID=3152360 RepID=UPI0032667BA9
MEWWIIIVGSLCGLLAIFLTGAPLFVGFLIVNLLAVVMLIGGSGTLLATNSIFDSSNISSLSAIPLFILMGEILTRSGSVENMFKAIDGLVGRIRGRQYVLTVIVSVVFGALSGAAMAVAAMLGKSLYPTMMKRGYDSQLSIGAILAGASLAPIIPPSVLAVVIATLADVSIGEMLIAGVVPGLIAAGLFLAYIFTRVTLRPELAPEADASEMERKGVWHSLLLLLPFSIIVFAIMGLILLGIATPAEAAASGVIGSVIVAIVYRQFSLGMLREAFKSAMLITAMIMVIVVSSNLFGQLLAFSGATRDLVAFGAQLSGSPYLLLFMLMAIVFVMCMFIDQIALLLILVPIYKPLIEAAGFDPIWFWVLVLLNLAVGGITPPFGYTLFAFKATSGELDLKSVYQAVWPWVGVFFVLMVIVALVPQTATWLPSIMR